MWYGVYLYMFMISLILSLGFTYLAKKLAVRFNFLDLPSERKFHHNAKPLLGGLGIFFSFFVVIVVHYLLAFTNGNWLPSDIAAVVPGIMKEGKRLLAILAGGSLMMLVGLYDDKKFISPGGKLLSQVLIASVVFFSDIRITLFVDNWVMSYVVTVLWVVFVINSFNLLDNIDGLSAGICLIAALIFFVVTASMKQYFISVMLLVLAGSVLGFLFYNFNPSSIFMGDCGSLFIGYMMAVLTIQATYYSPESLNFVSVVTPILILAIPLYDTFSVIVIRIKNKKSIFVGDKNHFSHRLVNLGMTARGAVLFLYLVSFSIGISSVLLPYITLRLALLILLQAVAMISVIAMLEYFGKKKSPEESI